MNESYFNGLEVVLKSDPDCLQKQDACRWRMWQHLRNRVSYTGPSLLATITYPSSSPPEFTPQEVGGTTRKDVMTEGIEMAEEGVVQFRTHKTDGCRLCPVRIFDQKQADEDPNSARRSTCGTIVDFTTNTIGRAQVERDGASFTCVIVRLASTTTKIGVRGREQIKLLGTARCLNLGQFNVEPIKSLLTSGNGSLTMVPYDQPLQTE